MVFLGLLLLAPGIPLGGFLGAPSMSSVSLGAVGIVLWAALGATHRRSDRFGARLVPAALLVIFAIYALCISLLSSNLIAMAYSLQYAFYLIGAYILLRGYLSPGGRWGDSGARLLAFVAAIFAVGCIVSLWTGPIYKGEAGFAARQWGGLYIPQGVGFASSPNEAGGLLIVLTALVWFAVPRASRKLKALVFIALLATISRSAITAFALGIASLGALLVFRALVVGKVPKISLESALVLSLTLVVTSAIVIMLAFNRSSGHDGLVSALAQGFGVGPDSLVAEDIAGRVTLWETGLDTWLAGEWHKRVLGRGFRQSFDIAENVWRTPHNAYLAVLGDFGLVGLLLLLLPFVWFLFLCAQRIIKRGGTGAERGAWVAVVALLLHNMTEVFFYAPAIMTLALLALLLFATETPASQGGGLTLVGTWGGRQRLRRAVLPQSGAT